MTGHPRYLVLITSHMAMLVLLSPAKSLDFESAAPTKRHTTPDMLARSAQLMTTLRKQSAADLSKLMGISEKLGQLNFQRNRQWKKAHSAENAKQCVFAFQGDVYQGLQADTMSDGQLRFCQKHVRILSGLYGLLRPLDWIQPYRLEMGTKLQTRSGNTLYDFWGDEISERIGVELKKLKSKLVVNLASNEYSQAAGLQQLGVEVVSPAFKDWKNGQYKMISFYAKKARGMMTRFLIDNEVSAMDGLRDFNVAGYRYEPSLSKESTPTFTRKQAS